MFRILYLASVVERLVALERTTSLHKYRDSADFSGSSMRHAAALNESRKWFSLIVLLRRKHFAAQKPAIRGDTFRLD